MQPGRLVSLCFVYVGLVALAHFGLGLALVERYRLTVGAVGVLVPGLVALYFGIDRIRHPEEKEEWPAEYGIWTGLAVAGIVGYTAWIAYLLTTSLPS